MGEELLESTTRTSPTGTAFYRDDGRELFLKNQKKFGE